MHTYLKYTLLTLLIFLSASLLTANTIIIDINGTEDYTTIQEGIESASDGDTVLVYPGTYYENIDYIGKNITVASKYLTTGNETYIDSTIIDGNYESSVVAVCNGETDAEICGFTIQHGSGYNPGGDYRYGGGIFISDDNNPIGTFNIHYCNIKENVAKSGGGGISVSDCYVLNLEGTKIHNNYSSIGGGFAKGTDYVVVNFSQQDRCDIYMNYAPMGSDIYNHTGNMAVFVDTFTVQEADKFYVYSRQDSVTMDILNHKIEPINHDLYVKPEGDNANTGLSWDEAYQNIYHALIMIKSDSLHSNTINVAEGFYSPSTTGEFFPLGGKEYISIRGAGKNETILDAEQTDKLVLLQDVDNFSIMDLRLQHGYGYNVGGIAIRLSSQPLFQNIDLYDNNISENLVTHLLIDDSTNPIFKNLTIKTTYESVNGVAINCGSYSNPIFIDSSIENNKTNPLTCHFGAMANSLQNYPVLINCKITGNYGDIASGIRQSSAPNDEMYLINCTICDNDYCSQGTISLVDGGHITLINTILRNDPATEIYFHPIHDPNSATIEYCNIGGGSAAVDVNGNGTLNWGEGNIDADPQFLGGEPFSYELTEGSPCIDAGTPDTTGLNLPPTDLAGNPRIYNGRIDLGAYEWQGEGIDEPDTTFVNKLYLFQNTPNPFKDETEILFITTDYERVKDYTLSIYNVKGQLVRRYSGRNHDFWVKTKITWDGTDENGNKVSPGVYFYKLEYGDNAVVRKMTLVE